jgi:hypothetical protein
MRALLPLVVALLAQPLAAQPEGRRPDPRAPEGDNMATPPTWHVVFDAGHDHDGDAAHPTVGADTTADVYFVNMTPGWHITTGPAAVFFHPQSTAQGTYRAEAGIHLFEPGDRTEAFGLVFGGRDMDGAEISYDYFLVRKTGEFLVKRRTGSETSVLIPWTAHSAIVPFNADTDGTAFNTLAIDAGADDVVFLVNQVEVARLPRDEVHADGIVGLRINHGLNVHVSDFAVSTE